MPRIFNCVIWTLTSSLTTYIKTDDFYKDIANDVNARFNTSGYEINHPLLIGVNETVICLMKDELGGEIITELMALRKKLYSYDTLNGSVRKKCKGVKKCIVKKTLDFDDYKQCLFEGENAFRKQLLFHNKLHEAYTTEVNKLALSRNNDKQVIQIDGVSTLAHGHKSLALDIDLE